METFVRVPPGRYGLYPKTDYLIYEGNIDDWYYGDGDTYESYLNKLAYSKLLENYWIGRVYPKINVKQFILTTLNYFLTTIALFRLFLLHFHYVYYTLFVRKYVNSDAETLEDQVIILYFYPQIYGIIIFVILSLICIFVSVMYLILINSKVNNLIHFDLDLNLNISPIKSKTVYTVCKGLDHLIHIKITEIWDTSHYLKNTIKKVSTSLFEFSICSSNYIKHKTFKDSLELGLFFFDINYSFIKMSIYLVIVWALTCVLRFLPSILSKKIFNLEKKSAYECGFEPFFISQIGLEVHFIIVGFIFLIFDLELIFIVSLIVHSSSLGSFGILLFLFYMITVYIMIFVDWVSGALSWPFWGFYSNKT